jgi:PIN domain nuclease of toxin-antitoxin system
MPFLLDTHTFLWFLAGDNKLPDSVKLKIKDIDEVCYLSVASLWEITIKQQIGKLKLDISLEELFDYAD